MHTFHHFRRMKHPSKHGIIHSAALAALMTPPTPSLPPNQQDVYTPLKLVIISGCVNAAGDLLLVGKLGMGVAGAAWATVASQFYLTAGLLAGLHRDGKLPSLLPLPKLEEYAPFSAFAKSITLVNLLKVGSDTGSLAARGARSS